MTAPTGVVPWLHSHLPYVLHHGRWPHGTDWLCEAALDTYLPLLALLLDRERRGRSAPITVGVTPVLGNMLAHPMFRAEVARYLDEREAACDEAEAAMTGTADAPLLPVVAWWRAHLASLRATWERLDGDIPAALRALQERGRLELTTSAATHALLPLLGRDESLTLQLAVGVAEHVRLFGARPRGCWLPECAWRPAGEWTPYPGAYNRGVRRGLEAHLAGAGIAYTCVDAHMARAGEPRGVYGTMFGARREPGEGRGVHERRTGARSGEGQRSGDGSPYRAYRIGAGVTSFVRDPVGSAMVWDRHAGYPGDPSCLEFHKQRWPGGLRLWRVTSLDTPLDAKRPYDPVVAADVAHRQGHDFARALAATDTGTGSVHCLPFDTELFGHWWFEGPRFLEACFDAIADAPSLRLETAGAHLARVGATADLVPVEGSWGRDGDFGMWMNDAVAWVWPITWELENRFWDLAPAARARPDLAGVVEQAARELLLLQSSDWPFIITTGAAADYASRRFHGHAYDCRELVAILERGLRGDDVTRGIDHARDVRQRDDLFPAIGTALDAVLHPSRP